MNAGFFLTLNTSPLLSITPPPPPSESKKKLKKKVKIESMFKFKEISCAHYTSNNIWNIP